MKNIFLLLLQLTLFQTIISAQNHKAEIDKLFERFNNDKSPGLTISIIQNNEVIMTNCYGMANLEQNIQVTNNTLFDLASVSKQFTGYAIAMLIEEGKLSAGDLISKYLDVPEYAKNITVEQLLHHTSGIRDWGTLMQLQGHIPQDAVLFEQITELFQNQKGLNFESGSEFSYSNTGFNLLALIIEKASGMSYAEFLSQRIFAPLGMKNTTVKTNISQLMSNRANSYAESEEGFVNYGHGNSAVYGAGSIFSTNEDMALWVKELLKPTLISKSTYKTITTSGVLKNGEETGYGYGLYVNDYLSQKCVWHSGDWEGFSTVVVTFPDQNFGMVMLSNLENMDFNEWVEIAKMYIGNHFKIIEAEDNSVRYSGMQIISEHAMDFNGSYEFTEDPGTIIKLSSNGKLFSGEINGEGGYTFQLMNDYILYSADNEVFVELIRATETEDKHIIWNEGGEWPAYEVRERSEKELMNYVAYYYCSEINATYSIDIHNGALFLSTGFGTEYKLISTGPMSFSNTTWLLDNVAFVTNEKNEIIAFLLDAYDVKGLYFEKMN